MMKLLFTSFFLIFLMIVFASCGTRNARKSIGKPILLKVMTYNVHHCNPPGKPGVIDIDGTAAVIRKENPDIVALQEIDVHTNRSGRMNEAEILADKAGYKNFYFAKAMDFDGGEYGIAILSRYPLEDTDTHPLPAAKEKGGEPRVVALATVRLPGGLSIRFGSTHLEAYNKESRLLQMARIDSLAKITSIPLIMAGDFNASENSDEIRILDRAFARTCSECAATFDEEGRGDAIDYIAFKKDDPFRVRSHEVIQNKEASDHMPVVAVLAINSD